MKRVLLVAFACAFLATSIFGEEIKDFGRDRLNNSPRHGEWIDIKSGDRTIKAFVVYPESKNKTPAVLVISEIFGLTDSVRSLCDELAENGVIAIAPDLHSGQKFEDLDAARKATYALPKEQVKADLNATSDYALKIPACNGILTVCGFCWGGDGPSSTRASIQNSKRPIHFMESRSITPTTRKRLRVRFTDLTPRTTSG